LAGGRPLLPLATLSIVTQAVAVGLGFDPISLSVQAWIGHARHVETLGFREKNFSEAHFRRGCAGGPAPDLGGTSQARYDDVANDKYEIKPASRAA